MKIKVLEEHHTITRRVACPICGEESPLRIRDEEKVGKVQCWRCESVFEWDISDEKANDG